ncbi:MAG: restriction endonuclease [Rikenellaceae bacterium]|jgi:hypothetical protein|nr:restriction endonuclease [Rikenellaceae bacterium]
MTDEQRAQLLAKSKEFFIHEIIPSHYSGLEKASRLSNYNINPFLTEYLANFLCGDSSPESIAKALIYPRILGTSITTIFGSQVQKMISSIFEGMGSTTNGIDIEYIDSVDGRRKYCQVKSGPNTINKDDVETVKNHFNGVRRLARTNNIDVGINDMVVGVLYGTPEELSAHYRVIAKDFPVLVGNEFWLRLTGDKDFYNELIVSFGQAAQAVDCRESLHSAIQTLADEIRRSTIF